MSERRHASLGIHHDVPLLANKPRMALWHRTRLATWLAMALLALGAVGVVLQRTAQAEKLTTLTRESGRLFVNTITAKAASGQEPLTLPSTLQGIMESPIYARSSGYLKRWTKDIGSPVKQGELLAEIDAPEIDQQLLQAIAARQQAAASLDLAKSSAERWQVLRQGNAVPQQELNERNSAYTQAQANLAAAEANVQRLQQTAQFKRVLAPFSGVITQRNVEAGDLIDAGNGGAGRALFRLSKVDTLRAYVFVPQAQAQRIKVGQLVGITQAESPGKRFEGTVVRSAGAIDPATRTLQIEVNLPNRDGALLAGAFVQVALPVNLASKALLVPSNVLLFRPQGVKVAVVNAQGKVQLKAVTLGQDLGTKLEVLAGIGPTDVLVLNPPDSMAEGDAVSVLPGKQDKP